MSDNTTETPFMSPSEALEAGRKPRGKVPRAAWGYVLGLYDMRGETLKAIGEIYGVEPSAVHYVLRQARLQNVEPTLDPPQDDLLTVARKAAAPPKDFIPRSVRQIFEAPSRQPVAPRDPTPMDAAVNHPTAKRVLDASAAMLKAVLDFDEAPSMPNREHLDEARKGWLRAGAAVELWMHEVQQKARVQQLTQQEPMARERERLPELA